MPYVPPQRALVRYPVEEGAAIQLQPVGVSLEPGPIRQFGTLALKPGVVAEFMCPIDHPLVVAALLRCEPKRHEDEETVIADLAQYARRAVDETPLVSDPVDYSGRPWLGSEPYLGWAAVTPLPPRQGASPVSTMPPATPPSSSNRSK